jgi:hypothetical protein
MAKPKLITKVALVETNDTYWDLVNRAGKLVREENPDKNVICVDEIHVDPEEDYVFVSWSYWEPGKGLHVGSDVKRGTSTSYRINKFLSLINKDAEVDPNDRIPVELKGAK